jgi:methionine biosynthesis protein MetW
MAAAPGVDRPGANDNRRYDYSGHENQFREEYPIIEKWIRQGERVIDFGCGNGALIDFLRERKQIQALGFDCSESGIAVCRQKGIDADVRAIDKKHSDLSDDQFDVAICNVTLQMTMYPEIVFSEMVRVARRQIISFPNFAFIRNRMDFFLKGRMPQPMLYGYSWFNTGHIHQFSISDFVALAAKHSNVSILEHECAGSRSALKRLMQKAFPNLFERIPVFLLGKESSR